MPDQLTVPKRRSAGQHAFAYGRSLTSRGLLISVAALLVISLAWLLGLSAWAFALVAVISAVAVVGTERVLGPRADHWLQGARGEREVGAILDGLSAEGWYVTHDVFFGKGNIDHVLIGPGGIFSVETKSHRGRYAVDNLDPKMLSQAYAQKKSLEAVTGMEVQPLLVFSRAYIVEKPPVKRRGVTILPARLLAWFISRRRPTMTAAEARSLHERLAVAVGQTPATGRP